MSWAQVQERKNTILDFIQRRFPLDNNWTDGNCYWFAIILTSRCPELEIGYDPINGHFVAIDEEGDCYYDYEGYHEINGKIIKWSTLKEMDGNWFRRIARDCVY